MGYYFDDDGECVACSWKGVLRYERLAAIQLVEHRQQMQQERDERLVVEQLAQLREERDESPTPTRWWGSAKAKHVYYAVHVDPEIVGKKE
eukprot:COSAG06_NODE_10783_length_1617_cov_1.291173_1_plen_90_part_10